MLRTILARLLALCVFITAVAHAQNQTDTVSPIFSDADIPFTLDVRVMQDSTGNDFLVPDGIQSYVWANYKDKTLILAGRKNGLHGFNNNDNPSNFPPQEQNRSLFVIDWTERTITSRSLLDPFSGLTQDQIDSLSTTAAQHYSVGDTLYITGGYGYRNSISDYTTFDILSALNTPGLIKWVLDPSHSKPASHYIRQVADPLFQVTGGSMLQLTKDSPMILVFGQDFEGGYFAPNQSQTYTEQVRRFYVSNGKSGLKYEPLASTIPDPNYHRRDLNVAPFISGIDRRNKPRYGAIAYSGVFTLDSGVWTVPVFVTKEGIPSMPDPSTPTTFKQGMNNYACPFLCMYSKKCEEMYTTLFGGLTYEYYKDGELVQDPEIPFDNELTTIKMGKDRLCTQHLMSTQFPVIYSTGSNPGNVLYFGTSSDLIPNEKKSRLLFDHWIFNLDRIEKPTVVGYIVGGIMSTMRNTESSSDSAASPYIFEVVVTPKY